METPLRTFLTTLALVGTAFAAQAQTTKAGLWEVTNKLGGNAEIDKAMAQMQQQMASMSPQQRKQMEAMMGSQGINMTGNAAGAMVVKTCITKEMAERSQLPVQTDGDCTSTMSDKSSTGMKFKFVCTKPPSSGEGQFTLMGDSAYTMKMKINSTDKGKPVATTMEGSGKWLSSDCGNVKPLLAPKK